MGVQIPDAKENLEGEKCPAQDMSDGRYTQNDSAGDRTDMVGC